MVRSALIVGLVALATPCVAQTLDAGSILQMPRIDQRAIRTPAQREKDAEKEAKTIDKTMNAIGPLCSCGPDVKVIPPGAPLNYTSGPTPAGPTAATHPLIEGRAKEDISTLLSGVYIPKRR